MQKNKKPIAAKKASPAVSVKKKTQALPAKKAAPKPAKKAVPVKKAAAKAAPAKAPVKTAASKAAVKATAKAAPSKADPKKDLKKKAAPAPSKPSGKPASKPEAAKTPAKVAAKPAAPAPKAAPASKKAEPKTEPKEEAIEETEVSAKADAPKATKARKTKETEVVEAEPEEEVVLLDAEGRRYCRVKDCDQASTVDGYCRYHYLLFWKNIQNRKSILAEGKLERYIEELTARYPDKYLEMLKKDLRSEKEFLAAIQELEIDEAAVDSDYEDEAQNYLDEVRGMSTESGEGGRGDDDSY